MFIFNSWAVSELGATVKHLNIALVDEGLVKVMLIKYNDFVVRLWKKRWGLTSIDQSLEGFFECCIFCKL